jgi:hypothetical protein
MYMLWNTNCKPERDVWVVKYKHNSYITLRLTVYISQLMHHAQACSLYFTTHALRSGLQFIFHNSYITLRLTAYMSCEIHTVSLSVMYELWNINCKPERNVWVVKYKPQLIHHPQASSLYFTTHTSRSGLQFIFHNSYITLRLAVYISQLIHYA